MKIKEISLANRPRERMLSIGPAALSDAELLAIILSSGYRGKSCIDLAHAILREHRLEDLPDMSVTELMSLNGIGEAKAAQLASLFELNKRSTAPCLKEKRLTSSSDVASYYLARLSKLKKEHIIAIFLDAKNRVIKEETISIGILDSSIIHPREVFRTAIKEAAASLILLHNHPSGDPSPSDEDIKITEKLREASSLVGIPLLDHIVIGNNSWRSIS